MHPLEFRNRLRSLCEPTIDQLGFELIAVEVLGGAGGRTVRLSVDGPRGVGADDCARISRHLGPVLDESDPIQGSYRLEVSSPGMDRPVQRVSDFERFVGYRAKIRLVEGPPRRRYTGTLAGVDGPEVLIECEGQTYQFPIDEIEHARLVLSLEEYESLGSAPGAGSGESDDQ
ncbi:MAG: ribosome maturation factor RimP [Deltaproteobacteria bacterium]|nr:MAG: ribosome maturation factor RimP [Deltaproteobacteria bacterium]